MEGMTGWGWLLGWVRNGGPSRGHQGTFRQGPWRMATSSKKSLQPFSLEKQTRTASSMVSASRILVAVVKMCYEAKEWDLLNENMMLLSERLSQLKQAVAKMVQQCYTYVEEITDLPIKLQFTDTLQMVIEGKIYVEIECVRLTKTLATIKEQNGDVKEAASILQELQVETYRSMKKNEQGEFILERMRLCLAVKDYIQTQIISNKMNTKFFQKENTEKLKLKYYSLMIQLDQHDLSICKHYRAIYDTPCIQGNKKLEEVPTYKDLLKLFTTMELMHCSTLVEDHAMELRRGSLKSPAAGIFGSTEEGKKVVEHSIRIEAKYYTRLTMKRMAQLLSEAFLSDLVVTKTIFAKVDRLAGIINFQRPKESKNLLSDWSQKLNLLMSLVNKTTHLIAKEEVMHNLQ
uniref:PCI domain-containing protein n=1 Tax=Saimiri boliviensis boliviensis TaxID=39432 RepID=A0A2K6U9K6_SAIBB